ncbi:MAG: hypothetical protein ACE5KZ_15900 [Candidatus Scalinduaceae bacterium]
MTSIEILATIFAIIVLVKLSIVSIKPKLWMKVAETILRNQTITTIVYLILAVIIGYYIFTSLNIVQVAVVMLFTSVLTGLGFLPYSKIMIKAVNEMLETRSDLFRNNWLVILIWAAIAVWVLCAVLT